MRCRPGSLDLNKVTRVWPGRMVKLLRRFSKRSEGLQPLLPDYLNAVQDSLSSKELEPSEPEVPKMPKAEPARSPAPSAMELDAPTATAKEKQVVAVSLQPGEALSPLKTLLDPRQPLPSHLARMGSVEVVKILNKLAEDRVAHSVDSHDSPEIDTEKQAEQVDVSDVSERTQPHSLQETNQHGREWDYRRLRLRVEPGHRHKIQAMMCKKILTDCLATLRVLQGQRQRDDPLWRFEGRRAYKLVLNSSPKELVRFLAFKHLHIAHGPLRRALIPGPSLTEGQMHDLQDEWRQLMHWFLQSVGPVPEEVLLRKFLDGELSWSLVLKLLRVDLSIGPRDKVDRRM